MRTFSKGAFSTPGQAGNCLGVPAQASKMGSSVNKDVLRRLMAAR
jgi:hypothetical protein